MKIHMDSEVFCGDESCGKVSCLIVNPLDNELTHFASTQNHFPLAPRDYLVSIAHIVEANEQKVVLDCSVEEFSSMENFVEREFVPSETTIRGYGSKYLRMPSVLMTQIENERVPAGELAIHRGTKVFAKNEEIGVVDDLLIKSKDDGHITHLVMREGHLWATKIITIPVSEIDKIDQDGIYLKLDREAIEGLPSMKIHGWFN